MDIFMRMGGLAYMRQWLGTQGYSIAPQREHYNVSASDDLIWASSQVLTCKSIPDSVITIVHNYYRYVASTETVYYQKIQVIVVDINPIQHILFDFHSNQKLLNDHRLGRPSIRIAASTPLTRAPEDDIQTLNEAIDGQSTTSHGSSGLIASLNHFSSQHISDNLTEIEEGPTFYGPLNPCVRFEVIHWHSGVAFNESFARIAEPKIWRTLAKMKKKYPLLVQTATSAYTV
ncbi:hypothetical protein C8R47DRAFT_1084281 [Mycena vitilis]|nr:hypothetical protein C8R47DRAFT_1084281 [Mycena vitilis]